MYSILSWSFFLSFWWSQVHFAKFYEVLFHKCLIVSILNVSVICVRLNSCVLQSFMSFKIPTYVMLCIYNHCGSVVLYLKEWAADYVKPDQW